jgi:hypothetical protein
VMIKKTGHSRYMPKYILKKTGSSRNLPICWWSYWCDDAYLFLQKQQSFTSTREAGEYSIWMFLNGYLKILQFHWLRWDLETTRVSNHHIPEKSKWSTQHIVYRLYLTKYSFAKFLDLGFRSSIHK